MDLAATLAPSARLLAGRYRRASLSAPTVGLWAVVADAVALMSATWFVLYATGDDDFAAIPAVAMAAALGCCGLVLVAAMQRYRVASLRRGRDSAGAILAALVLPLALFDWRGDVADTVAAAFVAGLLGPVSARLVLAAWLRWATESGLMERRAVLVGGGAGAREVIEGLAARPDNDVRVCAIFDDRTGARSPDLVLDVPRIGTFADLLGFARAAEIDLVVITLSTSAEARIAELLDLFATLPVPVHLSAFSDDLTFAGGKQGGLRVLVEGTFGPRVRLAKRAFDLVIGTFALLALSPVMAAAALAIRLDSPGPILFRQWRTGFAGRPVQVLKFRTMRAESADPEARNVVRRGDGRVTRVGRFLRKSSIDELPQLVNVLRGELSLVGPRPHAVDARSAQQEAFDALVADYGRRHRLPPGLTGWAQVHGWRGTVEAAEHLRARVDHDLWYIENWSPWLDLRILLRTPLSLFRTGNAF